MSLHAARRVAVSDLARNTRRSASPSASSARAEIAHDPSALRPTDQEPPHLTLRDFLRSLYFYWRIGFLAAVLVVVLGVIGLQGRETSSTAYSTIIKKNLVRNWFAMTVPDDWDRTLETDLALMKSEQIGLIVKRLVNAVVGMPNNELQQYVQDDEATASDASGSIGVPDESTVRSLGWLVIDYRSGERLPAESAFDPGWDTLVLDRQQTAVLVNSFKVVKDAGQAERLRSLASWTPGDLATLAAVDGDPDSGEITVSASSTSKEVAAFVANLYPLALVAATNRQLKLQNQEEVQVNQELLDAAKAELVAAKKRLKQMQQDLENELEATVQNPTITVHGMGYDELRLKVGQLKSDIRAYQVRIHTLEGEVERLREQYRQFADPLLGNIRELEEQYRRASASERPESPTLQSIRRRLDNLRQVYEDRGADNFEPEGNFAAVDAVRQLRSAENELADARQRVGLLQTQVVDLQAQLEQYPARSAPLETYRIEVDSLQQKVAYLTEKVEAARASQKQLPDYYEWKTTADPARAVTGSKTNWLIAIVVAAVLAGVGMARVAGMLDGRVQTEAQVRYASGVPPLLNLPVLSKANRYICRETSSGRRTNSFIYNLFGILAVNIRHLGRTEQPEKLLCVTSATPNEGKSFVAFNLSAYYALQGMRTCLLHCDYRHPTLEMFPDLDVDSVPGFIEYLANNGEVRQVEECIYPTDIDNLHVCLPGRITAPPMHLIDSPAFGTFLEELQDRYDVVIMDCAPLLLVVDTAIIARHARGTLLVTGLGIVKKSSLEVCVDRLAIQNIHVLGSVINRDRMASWNYYSHYYGDVVAAPMPASMPADVPVPTAQDGEPWHGTPAAADFDAMLQAHISSGRIILPGPSRTPSSIRNAFDDAGETQPAPAVGSEAGVPAFVPASGSGSGIGTSHATAHAPGSSRREPIVPEMDTLPRGAHPLGDFSPGGLGDEASLPPPPPPSSKHLQATDSQRNRHPDDDPQSPSSRAGEILDEFFPDEDTFD